MTSAANLERARRQARRADDLVGDRDEVGRAERLDEGIGLYQEALDVFIAEGQWFDAGGVSCNLGEAYRKRAYGDHSANLEQAISCFEAAVQYFTGLEQPVILAGVQTLLGESYSERFIGDRIENVRKAVDAYEAAAKVIEPQWAPDLHAAIQTGLGSLYLEVDRGDHRVDVDGAIEALMIACRHYRSAGRTRELAAALEALGRAFLNGVSGDRPQSIEAAIDAFTEASQLLSSLELLPDWAEAQVALAQVYLERILGERAFNVEFAITALRAALDIFGDGQHTIERAWALNKLGLAYRHRRRGSQDANLQRAERSHLEAIGLLDRVRDRQQWYVVQSDFASCLLAGPDPIPEDRLSRATEAYEEALATLISAGDGTGPHSAEGEASFGAARLRSLWSSPPPALAEAGLQHNLGRVYALWAERTGLDRDVNRAIGHCRKAFAYFDGAAMLNEALQTALTMARCYRRARHWGSAADVYMEIRTLVDALYAQSVLLSSKEAELASVAGVASYAAYALAKAGRNVEAVETVEWGRARLLGDTRAREGMARLARQEPETHRRLLNAVEELRQVELTERSLIGDSESRRDRDATVRAKQTDLLERSRRARNEFAEALASRPAPNDDDMIEFVARPSLFDIAQVAIPGVPLAYLLTTVEGSLILLVVRDGTAATDIAVSAIWCERFTEGLLSSLVVTIEDEVVVGGLLPGHSRRSWLDTSLDEALPLLGAHLARPLADALAQRASVGVIAVLCGDLALFPIHCAPYDRGDTESCLIDKFNVAFVPSARVPRANRFRWAAATRRVQPQLTGVADPASADGRARHRSLPWAVAELESIGTLFERSRTSSGRSAEIDAFLRSVPGSSHVHLACHGHFDAEDPMASGLVLAGGHQLTLRTLVDMRAFDGVYLVVASACQSALFDFDRLPDEVISLAGGFLYAGAQQVIASLWPVDDLSTAMLMHRFYRYHLRGKTETGEPPMPPVLALRRAQQWLATLSAHEARAILKIPAFARARRGLPAAYTAKIDRLLIENPRPFEAPSHWAAWTILGVD